MFTKINTMPAIGQTVRLLGLFRQENAPLSQRKASDRRTSRDIYYRALSDAQRRVCE